MIFFFPSLAKLPSVGNCWTIETDGYLSALVLASWLICLIVCKKGENLDTLLFFSPIHLYTQMFRYTDDDNDQHDFWTLIGSL